MIQRKSTKFQETCIDECTKRTKRDRDNSNFREPLNLQFLQIENRLQELLICKHLSFLIKREIFQRVDPVAQRAELIAEEP